ncbi:hypothetical protein [Nitrosococcus watsonii]|uniref:Uncharacterized protein n=1 Tax=Nitrosococcus watsoni (strain C-113) TaxID=105559 RepID=D8KBF6_NITWC|nr:hypothetical protein [Nitrosococcus watsonii]ADJ29603.1 hypothetical protein Nwat_2852 [Nitrosococcus watsonii C-113]
MNKRFLVLAGFVMASMATPFSLSAAASNSLNAFFTSIDDSGCITTEVSVTVHTGGLSVKRLTQSPDESPAKNLRGNINKSPGGEALFISISRIDECQGKVILYAKGKKGLGSGGRLRIASAQGTATLAFPLKIVTPGSGKPVDAEVNLTWAKTGNPVTVKRSRYFDKPGRLIEAAGRFKQTFQSAQASGSVSINGENFTPEASMDAGILSYATLAKFKKREQSELVGRSR